MQRVPKIISPARLYTAIVMLLVVILLLIFHSPFLLWAVLGVAYLIGFYESYKLYNKQKAPILFIAFAVFSWLWIYYFEPFVGVFLIFICLASYQAYTKKGKITQALPFLYPTIPFIFLYLLYLEYSINAIIWLLFIVALSDSFAFFGGKILGGKLFVNSQFCATSPNKTKEGVLVGILIATLVGSFVGLGVCGYFQSLILSFIVSFASIFGDLYESFIKREAQVKDSGVIFPGHGGMLDRLDGYFFGGIVLYALLNVWKTL